MKYVIKFINKIRGRSVDFNTNMRMSIVNLEEN